MRVSEWVSKSRVRPAAVVPTSGQPPLICAPGCPRAQPGSGPEWSQRKLNASLTTLGPPIHEQALPTQMPPRFCARPPKVVTKGWIPRALNTPLKASMLERREVEPIGTIHLARQHSSKAVHGFFSSCLSPVGSSRWLPDLWNGNSSNHDY